MSDRFSNAARRGWNGSPPLSGWSLNMKAYHEWGSRLNKLFTDAHGRHEVWPPGVCGMEFKNDLWGRALLTSDLEKDWIQGPWL